ncbi:hypothetical protein ACS0TY_024876 [Phlomoides rotata]
MMSMGDKSYSIFELGKKLHDIWNLRGNLNLIPHTRGYFTIMFSRLEDRDRVFRRRHWVLQPRAIHLQHWVQDFNPNKVCTSLAQVWVCLMDLPIEYWQPGILDVMASAMGSLIKIDDRTAHRRMGHYVRISVEIDMRNELIEKIMYKRVGRGDTSDQHEEVSDTPTTEVGAQKSSATPHTTSTLRSKGTSSSKQPGAGTFVRDTTVPTGMSINKFLKGNTSTTLIAPKRTLTSVVDSVAKTANESLRWAQFMNNIWLLRNPGQTW